MNIFPKKEESDTEIIIEQSPLGILIGMSFMSVSYLFGDQIGSLAGLVAMIGYPFIGIHLYRSITMNGVIRKAMKSGVNVHMSGSAFNFKNPAVYRSNKSEL